MRTPAISMFLLFFIATLFSPANAQSPVRVFEAYLHGMSGLIKGKVVLTGNTFVFVDDGEPRASFVLDKNNIKSWESRDGAISITTNRPIADRSGNQTHFIFRMSLDNSGWMANWWRGSAIKQGPLSPSSSQSRLSGPSGPSGPSGKTYTARLKKNMRHDPEGKLIVSPTMIAFISREDGNETYRWDLSAIKDIRQYGPYELEIIPYKGARRTFAFQGRGLTRNEIETLRDHIKATRSRQIQSKRR